MLYSVLALSLLPALAAAQTVHTIDVGQGGLQFSPSTTTASNGDIINFVFSAADHTVTQSTLANPCTPLDGGFNSGIVNTVGASWNLTISDATTPIWFFCAQSTPIVHCEQGMVGAINPPSSGSFSSFLASAKAATVTPSITAVALTGSGAAATATPGGSGAASGSATSPSGTSSGAPASTSSSAAYKAFAGFEGVAGALALLGAALF
ncbi:hypothetical protein DFH11DRAFT_437317 [Phellopilus nigrolimitatus]|nr:hypothetical protein DFH11DRAFT_437317 [Phellopilus nigrolimitatus]